MAYTNAPWSNIIPAGSASANTIDDAIRQLRLDTQERMDDLVDDWITGDPVIVNANVIKKIHWSDGSPAQSSVLWAFSAGLTGSLNPSATTATLLWAMPLNLPVGAVLNAVTARCALTVAADPPAFQLFVYHVDDTPTRTLLGNTDIDGTGSTGWQDCAVTALAHTVLVTSAYFCVCEMKSDGANGNSVKFSHLDIDITRDFALQGI